MLHGLRAKCETFLFKPRARELSSCFCIPRRFHVCALNSLMPAYQPAVSIHFVTGVVLLFRLVTSFLLIASTTRAPLLRRRRRRKESPAKKEKGGGGAPNLRGIPYTSDSSSMRIQKLEGLGWCHRGCTRFHQGLCPGFIRAVVWGQGLLGLAV